MYNKEVLRILFDVWREFRKQDMYRSIYTSGRSTVLDKIKYILIKASLINSEGMTIREQNQIASIQDAPWRIREHSPGLKECPLCGKLLYSFSRKDGRLHQECSCGYKKVTPGIFDTEQEVNDE